jgi:hypothetical protein
MFAAKNELLTRPSGAAYEISRSLRFNAADSAYLSRTPSTTTNRRTFTFSAWVKLSKTSDDPFLMGAGAGGQIWLLSDKIKVRLNGSPDYFYDTSAVFRDYSAWYHIVVGVDTTNATSADRVKIYVNSTQQAIGASSAPPQNYDTEFNLASTGNNLGKWPSGSQYLNGYMTEVNFIDGQALTPSSFGSTNADTGVWQPKAYSGSYGTNGFYLNFSDNSNNTSTTLGKDYSGNGNNWTPNNFSVTAGAGNDSLVDVPTPYGIDTGVGGTVRGNYCTMNPLSNSGTLYNGNLDFVSTSDPGSKSIFATTGVSSGKWYWEMTVGATANTYYPGLGINTNTSASPDLQSGDTASGYMYLATGQKYNGGTLTSVGSAFTTGDVIGVALDMDGGTIAVYKNNTSVGQLFSGITGTARPVVVGSASAGGTMNFGQRPFAYTAPSGFKALCTQNLPTPTIGATTATQAGKFFNAVTYTGNGTSSARSITGVGFQPDWVWGKGRSVASQHNLFDAVRGSNKRLISNDVVAEETNAAYGYLSSFDSDGFSTSAGSTNNENWNETSATYVAWNWKANGSGSTNTAGSITSTVSANTTSGFSIVNWTGSTSGSAQTVGHGLGVTPSMVILKNRSTVDSWYVYFSGATTTSQYLTLETTNAVASAVGIWGAGMTSTLVGVKPSVYCASTSNNVIMYCFAPIAGYSAFGSYTGNGSADGPFVFTGMRSAYVMIKRTDSTASWYVLDVARNTYNVANLLLYPNIADAEATFSTLDILSNGFKIRNSDVDLNASGGTYFFMAFASNPFKYSLAR